MIPLLKTFLLLGILLGFCVLPLVLIRKRHPVSAIAWSLTVIFIPWLGVFLFLVVGAFRVKRRLRRKLFHRSRFLRDWSTGKQAVPDPVADETWAGMGPYSVRVGGSPVSHGND